MLYYSVLSSRAKFSRLGLRSALSKHPSTASSRPWSRGKNPEDGFGTG